MWDLMLTVWRTAVGGEFTAAAGGTSPSTDDSGEEATEEAAGLTLKRGFSAMSSMAGRRVVTAASGGVGQRSERLGVERRRINPHSLIPCREENWEPTPIRIDLNEYI